MILKIKNKKTYKKCYDVLKEPYIDKKIKVNNKKSKLSNIQPIYCKRIYCNTS